MIDSKFKKLLLLSSVIALCGVAQIASAHTGIRDKVFIEGQGNTGLSLSSDPANPANQIVGQSSAAYNAFTVGHGCATNAIPEGTVGTPHANVIAVAALFPNSAVPGSTIIYRYKTGSIVANVPGVDGTVLTGTATTLPVTAPTDLTDDINNAVAGAGLSTMGLGLVSPNLFNNTILPILPTADAGATRGYAVYNTGKTRPLQEDIISTTGLSAFKYSVPTFKTTSCAANLIVRVAVSNWCKVGAGSKNDADRKDIWIGTDTGSKLYSMMGSNAGIMPNSVTTLGGTGETLANEQGNGKSFWPSFTVHRDLVKNPLPASCKGESYDVVVEPSGADIDKNLIVPVTPRKFF